LNDEDLSIARLHFARFQLENRWFRIWRAVGNSWQKTVFPNEDDLKLWYRWIDPRNQFVPDEIDESARAELLRLNDIVIAGIKTLIQRAQERNRPADVEEHQTLLRILSPVAIELQARFPGSKGAAAGLFQAVERDLDLKTVLQWMNQAGPREPYRAHRQPIAGNPAFRDLKSYQALANLISIFGEIRAGDLAVDPWPKVSEGIAHKRDLRKFLAGFDIPDETIDQLLQTATVEPDRIPDVFKRIALRFQLWSGRTLNPADATPELLSHFEREKAALLEWGKPGGSGVFALQQDEDPELKFVLTLYPESTWNFK
jgi:hypothetical protein